MSESFKRNLKHTLIAFGIFIGLALIYSYPALQGKELSQHDTVSWRSMSWEAREYWEATGDNPLWSNSQFGGLPTYTMHMGDWPRPLYRIQTFFETILPSPAYFLFFAMLGFFILLSTLKVNRWVAIVGAIAYAFASYNLQIIAAGHATKMLSIAFMPIALAGMIAVYRGKYITGSIMTLAGFGFLLQNGMYQIDYYLVIIMVILGVSFFIKAIQKKTLKHFFIGTGILVVSGLLALSLNLVTLVMIKDYGKLTMRGGQSELTINKDDKDKDKKQGGLDKDYAFQWSQGIGETFTLFVPNLYGGGGGVDLGENSNTYETVEKLAGPGAAEQVSSSASLYWGPQPFLSGPVYIGIITMLLMVLGLFLIKNNMKWVFFGIGVFGIMLSWGDHFSSLNYFLFDNLPMYNSFRTPSMSMVIPSLMFAVLAFWALNEFFKEKYSTETLWDALKKSLIVVGGLSVLIGLGGSLFLDFRSENDERTKAQYVQAFGGNEQAGTEVFNAIVKDRSGVAMKDGLRSLAFILLAGAALWLYTRKRLDKQKTMLIIGLLFIFDVVFIGWRYLNDGEQYYVEEGALDSQFNPRPVDLEIKKDPDPYYRVYDLSRNVYNDAMQAVHHKSVGGYHPAKLELYQDLIDVHLSNPNKANPAVLDMLNTKYIIGQAQNGQLVSQRRPTACGNGWFVREIKTVDNADAEMLALNTAPADSMGKSTGFAPLQTAVVQKKYVQENNLPISFTKDSSAQVNLTEYSLNHLYFQSSNSHDGYAVFSDIYYPKGWKAYIDNQEVPIIKTNYLLRGLFIPKGKHDIKFEFKPEIWTKYKWTMPAAGYLMLIIMLGLGFLALRNELKKDEETLGSTEEGDLL